ncbi:Asp23/Gls24 family envelope stress response protein [Cytobacillus sp. FJAT-54145]|uniref:Asp23/Gls24 family envelope stress response protein n=1 Tax=Cytobacillus spartinae TaxID=3299023 RepID=A0ABW6KKD1_9BACI
MPTNSVSSESKRALNNIISAIIESKIGEKDGLVLHLKTKDFLGLMIKNRTIKARGIEIEFFDNEVVDVNLIITLNKKVNIRREIENLQKQIIEDVKLLTGFHINTFNVFIDRLIL